jgi:hypothetical protein
MKVYIQEQVNPINHFELEIEYEHGDADITTYETYPLGLIALEGEEVLKFISAAMQLNRRNSIVSIKNFNKFEDLAIRDAYYTDSYAPIVGCKMFYYNSLGVKHKVEWEL